MSLLNELVTFHDFDEWVHAALRRGLSGPHRSGGFNSHHFLDKAGEAVAHWHGSTDRGTVPQAIPDANLFKTVPVNSETAPQTTPPATPDTAPSAGEQEPAASQEATVPKE